MWTCWQTKPRSCIVMALGAVTLMCAVPALPAGAQLPERVLVEEWRLGGPDGRGPAAFSSEPSVVIDRLGRLYTRGQRDSEISVLDSAGRFVRTIGRRGQGPGEFVMISRHGFIGDTLWVSNAQNASVSIFDPNGDHLATRRVIVELAERFAAPIGISALLANDRALVIPSGALVGTHSRVDVPVLLGDREMRSRDTLFRVLRPEHLFVAGVGTFWWVPVAMPPVIDVAPDGSGLLVVDWKRDSDQVQVRRFTSDGKIRWSRMLVLPSPSMGARIRDSIIARATQMATGQIEAAKRRGTVSPNVSTRSLLERSLDLPDRYPPVTDAVLGTDGTVWLHRGGSGPTERWVVIDSIGSPIFEVVSPIRLTVQAASRGAAWGTFSDEDGFPYLVRYRVVVPK